MSPVSMDIVVVFPAPLCPKSAVTWFSYIFKFIEFTATFLLNVLVNPLICIPAFVFGSDSKSSGFLILPNPLTGDFLDGFGAGAFPVQYDF